MAKGERIVICGAGIAGIATAYYLLREDATLRITLLDRNQPLSFTSSQSGENFRDYWPHAAMEALSSRSIDLMESLHETYGPGAFKLVFSGYHFVSHDATKPIFAADHDPTFRARNVVETNPETIHANYPYLDAALCKSVFIRKAGNVDSITLANLLLDTAKRAGATFVQEAVVGVQKVGKESRILTSGGQQLTADRLIIAAGPFVNQVGKLVGLTFPVWNTLQRKILLPDPLGVLPPDMPFTIYSDPQYLNWSVEERDFLAGEAELAWMTQQFPGALHLKPEGRRIKMGWAFSTTPVEPQWEQRRMAYFPQVILRGASRFVPALAPYAEKVPTPVIEYGGYYTRTEENWPLIGKTERDGVFVVGALAGFGTMTACAAGELCAKTLLEQPLPWYAPYFSPLRYHDPVIVAEMRRQRTDGQL